MNLIFYSKSLSIPGCLEKVWDSQDFHKFCSCLFFVFQIQNYWQNSSHSHCITDTTFTCLILKSYLPWTIRKMLTKLGICLWYISFRYICNWCLYSHANIPKSFQLILKYKDTNVGQSSAVLFQKKSEPLRKKRTSQKKAAVFLSDALAFCSSPGM